MTERRISRMPGIRAAKLLAGMRILWKPGHAEDVRGIEDIGDYYLKLTLQDSAGKERKRKIRKLTIVEGFWPS